MSYCRWSSDNWKSDVYCYEDVSGGWTTHVAGLRVVGEVPEEPDIRTAPPEEWLAAHKRAMKFLEDCERAPIGLAHDGVTFNDSTLKEFRDRLIMLCDAGYHVPAYVFDEIADEMSEASPQ